MRYIRIDPNGELPDLSHLDPFKVVLVEETTFDAVRRAAVSLWLVRCGCRYVIACGEGSQRWCAAVREANLRLFDVERLEARDFVMTTSHPHESPRAVLWYAKRAAHHPEVRFEDTVVLHLSSRDRAAEFEVMFRRA